MELKILIKNTEDYVAFYKKMLEEVSRDKIAFPPDDEIVDWYKALLREGKNSEQVRLKNLTDEKTHENQGLNPPFCYEQKKLNK